jgi:hypothetical protein
LAKRLVQHVGQFRRFAVLDRVNEDSSPGPFGDDVDPFEPSSGVGPGRLAVANDQQLIDPRNAINWAEAFRLAPKENDCMILVFLGQLMLATLGW